MTAPEDRRLYCVPDHEVCWNDPGSVWEQQIAPFVDADNLGPWIIEERTVVPPDGFVRSADLIAEDLVEWLTDDYAIDFDPFDGITHDPEVLAAAEALRQAVIAKVTWFQAGNLVCRHEVLLIDDEPYFDGQPMFRKAAS